MNDTVVPAAMLTPVQADRLTTRIQLRLSNIADNLEALVPLINDTINGEAHTVLGYASWTSYVADKFNGAFTRLGKLDRQPLVELFSGQGMSTRAIAPMFGTSHQTIANDLNSAGVKQLTPANSEIVVDAEIVKVGVEDAFTDPPERDYVFDLATATDEQFATALETAIADAKAGDDLHRENVVRNLQEVVDTQPAPRQITGRDGKTYTAPAPRARRRRPLPDAFSTTVYDLGKRTTSLANLVADDRFAANKDNLALRYRGHLIRALDNLVQVIEQLQ